MRDREVRDSLRPRHLARCFGCPVRRRLPALCRIVAGPYLPVQATRRYRDTAPWPGPVALDYSPSRERGRRMIPVSWPYSPETYEAFAAVKSGGFTVYCCGNRRDPHVLVAAYNWGSHIDVINIRGIDRVTAARLPQYDSVDIFAPTRAVWHYLGSLEPTVTAMLRLTPPSHPDAPTASYPAPLSLFVPSCEQRPMTVRPGKRRA